MHWLHPLFRLSHPAWRSKSHNSFNRFVPSKPPKMYSPSAVLDQTAACAYRTPGAGPLGVICCQALPCAPNQEAIFTKRQKMCWDQVLGLSPLAMVIPLAGTFNAKQIYEGLPLFSLHPSTRPCMLSSSCYSLPGGRRATGLTKRLGPEPIVCFQRQPGAPNRRLEQSRRRCTCRQLRRTRQPRRSSARRARSRLE